MRQSSKRLFAAALLATLPWAAGAHERANCSPAPCAGKDTQLSGTAGRRALIAADPANPDRLVVGAHENHAVCGSQMGVFVSKDRGKTWRPSCMGESPFETFFDSPAVVFNAVGDVLAMGSYEGDDWGRTLRVQSSADGGKTWSGLSRAVSSRYARGSVSNAYLAVDSGAKSKYSGNVYAALLDFARYDPYITVRLARSSNGGSTWSTYAASPEYDAALPEAPDLAIGRDGTLYLSYRLCSSEDLLCEDIPYDVMLVSSADGGLSWSSPRLVQQIETAPVRHGYEPGLPNTDAALDYRPVLAVDATAGPYTGRLYSVISAQRDGKLQILLSRSDDGGASWSAPAPVSPVSGLYDQFIPSARVNGRGELVVSWLDRRNDPQNVKYQPMAAVSTDGGASFGAPLLLDTQHSDPSHDHYLFVDDFIATTWAGRHLVTTFIGAGTGDAKGKMTLRYSDARP